MRMEYMRSSSMYEREETFQSVSMESSEESRATMANLKKEILHFLTHDALSKLSMCTHLNGSTLALEVIKLAKMMIQFGMFGKITGSSQDSEFNQLIASLFAILQSDDRQSQGTLPAIH